MKRAVLPLSLLLVLPLSAAPKPGDWPAWRGPSANGSVEVGTFPARWTPDQVAWKAPLPAMGVSTPIVGADGIYLSTPADGQDAVLALDRTGKQRWLTRLGPESPARYKTLASGSNASPVTDGEAIFARFRSGRLAALNLDGTVRWQFSLEERYGQERIFWDSGSSPVVTDDALIISRIHAGDSFIAGFDKQTGEEKWLEKRSYPCPNENDNGYATPVLFEHQGQPALLIWAADQLTAHSARDGRLLWSCGGFNPAGTPNWPPIASPVIRDNVVVVPVGRDDRANQARLHAVRLGGAGDVTGTHRVWQRDDLGVFCSSPVEYRGRIYLLRHRGGVVCVDPATGNTLWADAFPRASSSFYSSPIVANGILYAAREDGTVFTARVDERFELLGENAMGERVIASPIPMGDGVLIRSDRTLFYIAGKK
jgi:outer membrane protein assembly factor BamB